jgi:hypothetical protein
MQTRRRIGDSKRLNVREGTEDKQRLEKRNMNGIGIQDQSRNEGDSET